MSGEMSVMNGREYREPRDRLVLDGCEYSLDEVREGLRLLKQAIAAEQMPQPELSA